MVPKNREVHIGFGGEQGDTPPQWLGYVNHKVFGRNYTDELYQDEDTVPAYGGVNAAGTLSLDKICLAGEWECICATASSSGSIGDANTILTVTHNSHGLIAGDNLVVRLSKPWPPV